MEMKGIVATAEVARQWEGMVKRGQGSWVVGVAAQLQMRWSQEQRPGVRDWGREGNNGMMQCHSRRKGGKIYRQLGDRSLLHVACSAQLQRCDIVHMLYSASEGTSKCPT
jgi:hypothetical protein